MPIFWTVVAVIALIALGFGALYMSHNSRVRRARGAYALLPAEVREACLDLIARAAGDAPLAVVYVPEPGAPDPAPDLSQLAGEPFAEEGDEWPRLEYKDDGTPDPAAPVAPFLGQFRLAAPVLPAPWPGRLLSLFQRHDDHQTVWSFETPDPVRYRPLSGGPPSRPPLRLRALPWPGKTVDQLSSAALLRSVPELAPRLAPHGDPEGLLTQVLTGGRGGFQLVPEDLTYCGGPPTLFQGPHHEKCPTCQAPMRFLLQLADHVPGVQLADVGVVTVYGCDSHPDQLVGRLDSH